MERVRGMCRSVVRGEALGQKHDFGGQCGAMKLLLSETPLSITSSLITWNFAKDHDMRMQGSDRVQWEVRMSLNLGSGLPLLGDAEQVT